MMEVYTDVPKNFLKEFNRYEPVVLDHTALSTYKTCPRKYFFRHVLAFTGTESPPYFVSGSAYHKYRENFEINWKLNADLPILDRLDYSHLLAEQSALKLWDDRTGKKEVIAPHTKWEFLTRSRLIKTLDVTRTWLTTEKKNNIIQVVATEQPFIVEIVKGVFWGGRADQVVKWNGRLWGRDFKTSSKNPEYFKRMLKPSNQFIGYTVAEEILHGNTVDGQLVEVMYNTAKEGPKITPYPTSFNIFEKGLWKREVADWTSRLKVSRELDLYPANESHCPFCPYHMVCTSTSENGMEATLKSKYKVQPWDHQNPDAELEAA